jgi:hypothetical protein
MVENPYRTDLFDRLRNCTVDSLVKGYIAHTLATPAYKEYITDFSGTVKETDLL